MKRNKRYKASVEIEVETGARRFFSRLMQVRKVREKFRLAFSMPDSGTKLDVRCTLEMCGAHSSDVSRPMFSAQAIICNAFFHRRSLNMFSQKT